MLGFKKIKRKSAKKKEKRENTKRDFQLGLKGKLMLYFLLMALVPAAGLTIYSSTQMMTRFTEEHLSQLYAIGDNKGSQIISWFSERRGDVAMLSDTPVFKEWSVHLNGENVIEANVTEAIEEMGKALINVIYHYGTYTEMYFANSSGIVVVQQNSTTWNVHGHSVGISITNKEYWTACVENLGIADYTFLSDFRRSSNGLYIQITVSSPVYNNGGDFMGVLVSYIDSETVDQMMADVTGLGTSGETYLVNKDLMWLTASKFTADTDWYLSGTGTGRGYDDIRDTILDPDAALSTVGLIAAFEVEGDIDSTSNLDYRGTPVMGSYLYIDVNDEENGGWVLVAEIDVVEALKAPTDLQQMSIWIMVAVAGVVAVTAFIIARQIANPVKQLSDLSETIAGGNYDVEVEINAQDEVGELVTNFKVMKENVLNALKYSENLITGLPVSVMAIDNDFNIEKLNSTLESLIGIKKVDFIGKKCYDVFRYDICNTENCQIRKAWIINGITDSEDIKTHNRDDQTEMELRLSSSPLIDGVGNITGGIEVSLDVTLENQMKREAKQSLNLIRKNILEKEILLGEIHHRVKNNMQIVSSLLKLQGKKIKDSKIRQIFEECNTRISVISHIHEILYRSKDFSGINFSEYIENLCMNLYQLYGVNSNRILLYLDTEALTFEIGIAIPCGLIVNEIVSNSLKYAFSEKQSGEIKITLQKINENKVYLSIEDNGIGLPENIDVKTLNTLGLNLAKDLAEHQLHGQFNISSDNGTKIEVSFTVNL